MTCMYKEYEVKIKKSHEAITTAKNKVVTCKLLFSGRELTFGGGGRIKI